MTTPFSKMLGSEVRAILHQRWRIRKGLKVPTPESVLLSGGGVRFEGTVLYADLAQSSLLATDFQKQTAAKIIKSFLRCCSRIITKNKGKITSFDGDRVMGIFQGNGQENRAVLSGLQIHSALEYIIRPKLTDHFQSIKQDKFTIDHCVGIDKGETLAVRAGHAGSNDLIWIGRAPNLAAKLSDVRNWKYKTVITQDVYDALDYEHKYDKESFESMWEKRLYDFLDKSWSIYVSDWLWRP